MRTLYCNKINLQKPFGFIYMLDINTISKSSFLTLRLLSHDSGQICPE